MKFKEFKHEPVRPDTYEASMARNQLMRIGKHAIKLHNMIDDAAEMESWVAKKIDLAGDYVKKVYNYTEGEKAGLYDDGGLTEEAPFGSGMDLVRMAVLRKFISAEEYMAYAKELKAAGEEVAQNYDDWPEGEGFGSSDGNFAIKDLMTTAGYEFDEQDLGGRFIVTKMPEKLEKMGIKNVRMRDAVTTEDAGDMDLIGDGAENLGLDPNKFDYYYDTSGAGYGEVRTKSGKSILQFEYDRDGDAEVSTMDNKTIANIKQGEQLPNNVTAKLNMIKEDAGEDEKIVDMLRNIKQHLDNHPNMSEHPSLVALDQLADDLESGDKPADYESVSEDAGDQDDWTKLLNAVAKKYGKEKARVIHDYAQHGTDSGRELMRDYGLTPGDGWWEDQPKWFKKFPWLEKLDKTSWMSRLVDIAGEGPEYGGAGYEYPKGLESLEARLEAKLREEQIDIFDFEKRNEYNDDQEKYGDVDKTPLTPQERQQFKQWLISTANTYAQMAVDDGVDDIGEDLSNIEDQNHKFIPKIKEYLKQSYAKGNLEDFAGDVLDVEEKFGDPDMLLNDRGFRVAKDFSQHATNYEVFIKYASGDYTVKTIRGILDSIDDDPHISSAMLMFQTDFEGTPLQRKVSRVQASESVSEDAGEGHMSKSTLYHTAKYAIALMDMIKPGDDLEGWVQSKLNKAADYLQGVYNYEEYQKLNPYREELNSDILQRHAGIVQKHIDEILAKETKLDDIDTKPGMMRILAKRVNEVEKEIAKEQRKNTDEAHGGQHSTSGRSMTKGEKNKREKIVKGMKKDKAGFKKRYGKDAEAVMYATATKNAMKDDEQYDEGKLKDWAKSLAMAGIFVAGMAGVGSINDAINNSVPAIQAMNTALELAQKRGDNDLVAQIEKDLKDAKLRLDIGRDLNQVKHLQDKYEKFIATENLAYESRLAMMLNQHIK